MTPSSPTLPILLGLFCVILHQSPSTDAYPSGPPPSACTSLDPTGHNASPQNGASPYEITLDSDTYSPGQTIRGMTQFP